jgi:hypothetical protein
MFQVFNYLLIQLGLRYAARKRTPISIAFPRRTLTPHSVHIGALHRLLDSLCDAPLILIPWIKITLIPISDDFPDLLQYFVCTLTLQENQMAIRLERISVLPAYKSLDVLADQKSQSENYTNQISPSSRYRSRMRTLTWPIRSADALCAFCLSRRSSCSRRFRVASSSALCRSSATLRSSSSHALRCASNSIAVG